MMRTHHGVAVAVADVAATLAAGVQIGKQTRKRLQILGQPQLLLLLLGFMILMPIMFILTPLWRLPLDMKVPRCGVCGRRRAVCMHPTALGPTVLLCALLAGCNRSKRFEGTTCRAAGNRHACAAIAR